MGIAVNASRLVMECGSVDNARHYGELLNELRSHVEAKDFQQNYEVYARICILFSKDPASTVDDVKNMMNSLRSNSKDDAQKKNVLLQISVTLMNLKSKEVSVAQMNHLVKVALNWNVQQPAGFSTFEDYAKDYLTKQGLVEEEKDDSKEKYAKDQKPEPKKTTNSVDDYLKKLEEVSQINVQKVEE